MAFIKRESEEEWHPKEAVLFNKIQNNLWYKSFGNGAELVNEVTKVLVVIFQQKGILSSIDFDSELSNSASITAIYAEKVTHFINLVRYKKGFPLRERTALPKVLAHLNFLSGNQVTNSALLVFGANPQQYFPT